MFIVSHHAPERKRKKEIDMHDKVGKVREGVRLGSERHRCRPAGHDAHVDADAGVDLRPVQDWQERPVPWDFDDADEYAKELGSFMKEVFFRGD